MSTQLKLGIPKMVLTNKGLIVDYDALKKYLGATRVKEMLSELTLVKKKFAGHNRTTVLISKIYKFIKIPNGKTTTLLTLPRFFQDWTEDFPYQLQVVHDCVALSAVKFLGKLDRTTGIRPPTIVLKDYQQVIHDHLINTVYRPEETSPEVALGRGCVLVLDTGRGKTYTAGGIIRTLGVKTLVIAHNSRGLAEWEKMLKCFPNIKIGYYCTKKKMDGDVVIMVINSAMRPNFDFSKKGDEKEPISRDKYFKQCSAVHREISFGR